jgi:sulfur carrier protein
MQIQLNGEPFEVADDATVLELIEALGLAGRRLAVEVNREIVPRGEHPVHCLQPGDKVEVVHAIGGG